MKAFLGLFVLLLSCGAHAQDFERKTLYYDVAAFKLNDVQKKTLDSVVVFYSNRRISINGHADYMGAEDRNTLVAELRARVVLRYLVDRGFPETQIMNATGAGQNLRNDGVKSNRKEDDALNRRVDVLITKGPRVEGKLKDIPAPEPPRVFVAPPTEKVTKINYEQLKVGDVIALKNISFIAGTDRIVPEAMGEIDNLFDVLVKHPKLKVRLEGHVCCVLYPDGYEPGTISWSISEARARRVQELLVIKGIQVERLSYQGYGRTRPLMEDETTQDQAQANRRVEIRIIEK